MSYYFPHKVMWRAFFAALTAAFTLQLMNPYFSGHLVLFYANYSHQWHLFEFIPFVLIGVFGVRNSRGWREEGEGGGGGRGEKERGGGGRKGGIKVRGVYKEMKFL